MFVDKVFIDDIVVGERRREEFGDIDGLTESINTYGLFHPVIIDDKNNLIAGERRLRACKLLGWSEIPARLFQDLTDKERREIELEENMRRKDLTPYEQSKELVKKAKKIAPVISTAVVEKDSRGRKTQHEAPKKDIAQALGIGASSLVRAEQHVAAVEKYPELSVVPTQKDAVAAAKALDKMPERERRSALTKIISGGKQVVASITGKPSPKAKPKSASSKYRDNLSQIQTFIYSIKSVGAEELTAAWTEAERHAFIVELRECHGEIGALVTELEKVEREAARRAS
jgi:ParB-like chromosome segregation protein Spo0J